MDTNFISHKRPPKHMEAQLSTSGQAGQAGQAGPKHKCVPSLLLIDTVWTQERETLTLGFLFLVLLFIVDVAWPPLFLSCPVTVHIESFISEYSHPSRILVFLSRLCRLHALGKLLH